MPIAHCLIAPDARLGNDDLVQLWSEASGQGSRHMTVNLVRCEHQFGQPYAAMATLYLPSMWSAENVTSLQVGLARALSTYLDQPLEAIHVITRIVEPGLVVEAGEVQWW
jgi:hypothetical protein